jgi:hypothetical protein
VPPALLGDARATGQRLRAADMKAAVRAAIRPRSLFITGHILNVGGGKTH